MSGRLREGEVIDGRFVVRGLLETGAMGEVYRVEQISPGMVRALKVIKTDLTDGKSDAQCASIPRLVLSSRGEAP